MKFSGLCITLLLSLLCMPLTAQDKPSEEVRIAGSEQRILHSKQIDQDYKLWISVPQGYAQSTKAYPVIYLLDAQWDFTLMISLYGQLRADGDIPEAVLVGLSWQAEPSEVDALRARDFIPTVTNQTTGEHSAQKFLQFFEQELIPYVAQNYRVTEQRVLIGSSFAGWFTLYSMFQRPDLFSGFLATAATIELMEAVLLKNTDGFAERIKKHKTRLYMAVGDRDGNKAGYEKAIEFFEKNKFQGLSYHAEVFDNTGHSNVKGLGNSRGLQYLFQRPTAQVAVAQLQSLVGIYKTPQSEDELTVSLKDQQLVFEAPGQYQLPLTAASDTHFYWSNYLLDAQFSQNNGKLLLDMEFFGSKMQFERKRALQPKADNETSPPF